MTSILADLARSRRPLVTILLIAINATVFVYELSLTGLDEFIFFHKYGLIPAELTSGEEVPLLVNTSRGLFSVEVGSSIHPWGTVFSSMFIHGSILHLVGNMLFLWGFGYNVEEKLGHVKYLLFYLGVGIAAAWAQIAVDLDSQVPMIGASGAISGVLGAYILAFPYRNVVAMLFLFFVLPLFFSVGSVGPGVSGGGVAYMAHLGGLVAGVLFMAGYKYVHREPILPRRQWPPWRY